MLDEDTEHYEILFFYWSVRHREVLFLFEDIDELIGSKEFCSF